MRRRPALQLVYPGTRISTLQELFDFLDCADPHHQVLLNIESKIDPWGSRTLDAKTFVQKQHDLFSNSHYYHSITVSRLAHYTCMRVSQPYPSTKASIGER